MQNAQRRSQPSWTFRKARVRAGPAVPRGREEDLGRREGAAAIFPGRSPAAASSRRRGARRGPVARDDVDVGPAREALRVPLGEAARHGERAPGSPGGGAGGAGSASRSARPVTVQA